MPHQPHGTHDTPPSDATRPGVQGERWAYAAPTPEDLTELDEEDRRVIRQNFRNLHRINWDRLMPSSDGNGGPSSATAARRRQ